MEPIGWPYGCMVDDPPVKWSRTHRKKLLAAGIVTVLAAITGTGAWAITSGSKSDPVDYVEDDVVRTPDVPLDGTPSEILQAILQRLGSTAIITAEIGGPPPGFQPVEDETVPVPPEFATGKWVYITLQAPSRMSPGTARALWHADLLIGALRDGLHATGENLYGARIRVQFEDGEVIEVGGGPGDVVFRQQFEGGSAQSIEATLRMKAGSHGLQVKSVGILAADQPAPAVVVQTSDPAQFMTKANAVVTDLFGIRPRYEGFYFEVDDPQGDPVLIEAAAFRSGVSREYVAPAYR